jgi:hypothetical protein
MPKRVVDRQEKRRETMRRLELAEQGDASAQNAIAAQLAQGYFVRKDLPGALYWYAQAMKHGYTQSMWNAGTMLVAGEGLLEPLPDIGNKLIEQAAACGDSSACAYLRRKEPARFVENGPAFDLEVHVTLSKPRIEWDLLSVIDDLLEPCGFARGKMTWRRIAGSMIDVIELQISKTQDTATINAGVLDTEIYTLVWNKPAQPPYRQPDCTVAVRIGGLLEGLDKWWELESNQTSAEIVSAIRDTVLPFLDRMHSRPAMEQWLIEARVMKKRYPLPILHLALLKHLVGKTEEACGILQDLGAGAWGQRAMEVAARIGCEQCR